MENFPSPPKETSSPWLNQFKSFAKNSNFWQSGAALMKSIALFSIFIGLELSAVCQGQIRDLTAQPSEVLARLHFAGFDQLTGTTNAATMREVWELPVSIELRDQALQKVAGALAQSFTPRTNAALPDASQLIRPMLDDLWRKESYFELMARTNSPLEWTLAIQLDQERSRLWQTNWIQLSSGWDIKRSGGTNPISFAAIDSWFLINFAQSSQSGSSTNSQVYQRLRANGRPIAAAKDYWLKAEADFPRLAQSLSFASWRQAPSMELIVTGKGLGLRAQAHLAFSKPMPWSIEKWRIPTNTITDPANSLIGFTAVQGLAPLLNGERFENNLGMKPVPNQLFIWGQSYAPLQILAAFQVGNVTNVLRNLSANLVPLLNSNLIHYGMGQIESPTNRLQIVWSGLPIIVPYLSPAPEPSRDFVVAGIFPIAPSTNPAPSALLAQLTSRTNLLYYDWEITESRLTQVRPLVQVLSMFTTIPQTDTNSLSTRWLEAVGSKLGNTITEISAASPQELTFVRNSHVGFSGPELVALAYWLEGTNFPRINYRISFPPPRPSRKK